MGSWEALDIIRSGVSVSGSCGTERGVAGSERRIAAPESGVPESGGGRVETVDAPGPGVTPPGTASIGGLVLENFDRNDAETEVCLLCGGLCFLERNEFSQPDIVVYSVSAAGG